jgi:hypothetical protein
MKMLFHASLGQIFPIAGARGARMPLMVSESMGQLSR